MALAGLVLAEDEALAGARNSGAVVLAIRVMGAALAYLAQVLFARLMGKADYGVFATASVLLTLLGHASLWGLGQSACRFVPLHRARGELALLRGFLMGGTGFSVVSGLATAAVGGLFLGLAGDRLAPEYKAPLALALATVPLFALQDYAEGVARSFNWAVVGIAPPYVLRQGFVVGAMLIFVAAGAKATPSLAVAAILVATAVTLGVQAWLILRRLRRELPRPGERAYDGRLWARTSLPIAFVDLTVLGFGFIDILLLGFFVPSEAVAVYFAATRILQFVAFVQYAASAATAQRFAEAHARDDRVALSALAAKTARLTAIGTAAVGLGVVAISPLLFALFGPGFEASIPILAILIAGLVAQSACGPGEDLLNMLGAERTCALVSLAAVAMAIALNLALIPLFGTMGAAIAMALAGVARSLALAVAARRRLGVTSHIFASAVA